MNNLLVNVEQNPLAMILQSFSTVTSSLQHLTNEIISLHGSISALETSLLNLTEQCFTMSDQVQELEHRLHQIESNRNTFSINTELPTVTRMAAVKPFKDMIFSRNYPHPKYSDGGGTRQFGWPMYRQLGLYVMQQCKGAEYWKGTYYLTFKKNVIHYGIATAQQICATLRLPESSTWKDLTNSQKEAAIVALEECVGDDYPLKACEGFWGARLLMVNAWGKSKENTTSKHVDQDQDSVSRNSMNGGDQDTTDENQVNESQEENYTARSHQNRSDLVENQGTTSQTSQNHQRVLRSQNNDSTVDNNEKQTRTSLPIKRKRGRPPRSKDAP
ncbi:hypothetical protein BJV82DRAFT_671317 [Fennellomyces sp. T-0311]|nr:hypothetical protein BJV82DRAFT_671317 [Fennellomyces sp. T-0311]